MKCQSAVSFWRASSLVASLGKQRTQMLRPQWNTTRLVENECWMPSSLKFNGTTRNVCCSLPQCNIWLSRLEVREGTIHLWKCKTRNSQGRKKGKSVRLTGPRCPEGSRKLRFPVYVTMAQIFRQSRPAPRTHPASCKMGTGSFPGVKCGRGLLLTTHPLLEPRSWKSRAIPLPTLWVTSGLKLDHFALPTLSYEQEQFLLNAQVPFPSNYF